MEDAQIEKSSFNKLNEALKKNERIGEKEFYDLKNVIDARNYINHDFFLSDFQFQCSYDSFGIGVVEPCLYDEKLKEIEKILNAVRFYIFEATDVIANKIDELKKGKNYFRRPVIFDEQDTETEI